MDAALWELLEEGDSEDEIAAIIRLGQPGVAPPGVRLVTQFGHIATCRLPRGKIIATREDESVASFKAARVLAPEPEIEDSLLEDLPESFAYEDERRPPGERATGRGVVVGVVDWGCDFAHPDFRNPDGSTRLLALWDQRSREGVKSPEPYHYGVVHTAEAINRALGTANPYAALNYDPADSDTGKGCHGTHVLSIAAGNGRGGGPQGVAPEALLVFVHSSPLSNEGSDRLGDSVTLLEAVDFIARIASSRPWVINLSMGRHGEQHDGSTLVEQGLDEALRSTPGCAVVQSTGNYFERGIHSSGQLRPTEERTLNWEVAEVDPTPNQLEIWYSGLDSIEIELSDQTQSVRQSASLGEQVVISLAGKEIGKIYHRRSEPNNLCNHVEIFLYPGAPPGRWAVTLKGNDIVDGRYHAWIERDAACPRCQSRFSAGDSVATNTTGTICNGFRTIAVGAYNPHSPRCEVAPFSSSGPTRDGRLKPDLLAPGVRILAARSRPREFVDRKEMLTRMSGTSMASPYVAGTVALMFEVAPRPLRVEETHNLLLASTRKANLFGENIARIGSGYCEISAAVEAARMVGKAASSLRSMSEAQIMSNINEQSSPRETVTLSATPEDTSEDSVAVTCDSFEAETGGLLTADNSLAEDIPASQLHWDGSTPEQLAFMRRVYERQLRGSDRPFIGDIPQADLAVIEGHHRATTATAEECRELLSQARAALHQQQAERRPQALRVNSIYLVSAYRSASEQFALWQQNFHRYYEQTQARRATLAEGEHGEAAANLLAGYISGILAAPGHSRHNNGIAVDFGTVDQGRALGARTDQRENWRASWFFTWLIDNAVRFGFYQNLQINEPWHWEHRGTRPNQRETTSFREYAAEAVNVPRAVQQNRTYAQSLGWQAHYDRINPLLGFTNFSPGEEDFALAVGRWQRSQGFREDGVIGPDTWARMRAAIGLGQPPAPTSIAPSGSATPGSVGFSPAEEKALHLTNAFENTTYYSLHRALDFGGLSADFDGQGLSFGLLQWNFGTGSLQPLLNEFATHHAQSFDQVFGSNAAQLRQVLSQSRSEQMTFIRSINDYTNRSNPAIIDPWRSQFRSLAANPEFQQIELHNVRPRMNQALASVRHFNLLSERGLVFMFDTVTQHGGGWLAVGTRNAEIQLQRAAREHELGRSLNEIELLTILANVIADSVRPQYIENVRRRRMTIVNGHGVVHGHSFDLQTDFGITDQPWNTTGAGPSASGQSGQEFGEWAGPEYDELASISETASDFGEDVQERDHLPINTVPLLSTHGGRDPHLVLRWNHMDGTPSAVDVVVHLHGYSRSGDNLNIQEEKLPISGLDFSDRNNPAFVGRRVPTLLILPRGKYIPPDHPGDRSDRFTFRALTNRSNALRDLVDYSLTTFSHEVGLPQVRMGRLILTAHSGGGAALREILNYIDPDEVHIFDALYGPSPFLIRWLQSRIQADQVALSDPNSAREPERYMREHGGALRVLYLQSGIHGTQPNSLAVRDALDDALNLVSRSHPEIARILRNWYRVEVVSGVVHNDIPRHFGLRLLADASANLPDASAPTVAAHRPGRADADSDDWTATSLALRDEADDFEATAVAPTGMRLVAEADEAVGSAPRRSFSTAPVLGSAFESVVGQNPFVPEGQSTRPLTSAALFEAFAYGNNPAVREHFEQFFEVVARPRTRLTETLPGDFLVRGLGEGGRAHISMLATGQTFRAHELASAGLRGESARPGHYAKVIEAGAFPHRHGDQYARRLSDESGLLTHDSLVLRIRPSAYPVHPARVEQAESDAAEVVEAFSAVESRDVDQWASVPHFTEEVDPNTMHYDEDAQLDSTTYPPLQNPDLTTFGMIRPAPAPVAMGAPNYQFRMRSRIYYPRGSVAGRLAGTRAFPVVIIVHGNHNWSCSNPGAADTEINNHLGYEYLQQELARHGLVSMSINTNQANLLDSGVRTRAEFVLKSLSILRTLNDTPGDRFHNRLDLHNIGLAGHSRGGDAVVKAVVLNRGNPDFTIRAVCSIAPTDITADRVPVPAVPPSPASPGHPATPGVPAHLIRAVSGDWINLRAGDHLRYLVLYGSHDGDPSGFLGSGTGFSHYDRATCERTMIFVHGITHNRFNTEWDNERHYGDPSHRFVRHPDCHGFSPACGRYRQTVAPGPACPPFDDDIRSAAAHQQLAKEYVVGLFRFELNGESLLKGLFNGLIAPTGCHSVSIQWSFGAMLEIENFEDSAHNKLGGAATYTGTIRVPFVFGAVPLGVVPHETTVLKAATSGATYQSEIPPANRDLSAFDILTLRMTSQFEVTSADTIDRGSHQNFVVRITFGRTGGGVGTAEVNRRHIDTCGVRAPNRPFFHSILETGGPLDNVTKTALETLVIPLRRFRGVNWRDVRGIELVAGPSVTAALFVDSLAVVTS